MIDFILKFIELVINILNALLIPLIAIIAAYIAYQQYSINRKKVKLDLYEKRYNIYKTTKKILFTVTQDGKIELKELKNSIIGIKNESKFLFNKEVVQFIKNLQENSIKLNNLNNERIKTTEQQNKANELTNWFTDNYINLEDLYNPYLSFKNIT